MLLIFDHLQLSFRRRGVTGVAVAAPVEMGKRHGVYVADPADQRVRAFLHKPSSSVLSEWGAVDESGAVQIDTGLVWMEAESGKQLAALTALPKVAAICGLDADAQRSAPAPLNLYGDLLLPLARATTWQSYQLDSSDGPATAQLQGVRGEIWAHLRELPFSVEQLQPYVFVHFGSSQEY